MASHSPATIDDLYNTLDSAKAELIQGTLVPLPPTGGDPGYAGDEIFVSLREWTRRTKIGRAVSDNKGFCVALPHRESFSPDAALYVGPNPGMKFYDGAPVFAAEVRSERDYGPEVENALARKRADYFAAGTLVIRGCRSARRSRHPLLSREHPCTPPHLPPWRHRPRRTRRTRLVTVRR